MPGSSRSLGLWWRNREPLNDCEEGRVRCSGFEELTLACLEDARERATESDNALSMGRAKGMEGREGYCPFKLPFPLTYSHALIPLPTKENHFLNLTSCSLSLPFSFPFRHLERAVFTCRLCLLDSHSLLIPYNAASDPPRTHSDLRKPTKELSL